MSSTDLPDRDRYLAQMRRGERFFTGICLLGVVGVLLDIPWLIAVVFWIICISVLSVPASIVTFGLRRTVKWLMPGSLDVYKTMPLIVDILVRLAALGLLVMFGRFFLAFLG